MASSRSSTRLVRFGVFALVLIFCGYILTKGSSYSDLTLTDVAAVRLKAVLASNSEANAGFSGGANAGSNAEPPAGKMKATFITLARNSDINGLSESIRNIEDRFNKNYHYDWVFLNDEPFSAELMTTVSALTSGVAKFGVIPKEHWSYPEWIDREKAALAREEMAHKKVIYGGSETYRHMCRFESGFFFRHELLKDYEYYWRVEPDIKIFCDIDYDIFKFMQDNDKWYGWTITLPEYKETIPTLWETTKKFIKDNPQYVAPDNNMNWISDDNGESYNGCHFWSNFEIGNLKLWRSEAYLKYFDTLDKHGGFFYERWGDAPVHSIAASIFMPRDKLHFFGDLGYYHVPFHNCPIDDETRLAKRCVCNKKDDFTWKGYSCTPRFFTLNNMKRPKGWEQFTG
ncbi:glycosyl transferase [Metschnikowia bicuspidata]|uniref:Glycosyl transferase n=1 Tax=Metschnikowia bicuspidata TaxID=27322 RepID=A0A4P9ZG34_9ASCO|nr:glycosyl transferase [Metschnikowia bicuspidata]